MARRVTIHSQSSCALLLPTHAGVAPSIRQIQVLDNQLDEAPFLPHPVFPVWDQHLPVLPPVHGATRPAQLTLQSRCPALRGLLVPQLLLEMDWQGWEMQKGKGLPPYTPLRG